MQTSEEIVLRADRLRTLCRNIFSSGQGKELLDDLKHLYVDGNLYADTDRETAYLIGQRDVIMELIHAADSGVSDE